MRRVEEQVILLTVLILVGGCTGDAPPQVESERAVRVYDPLVAALATAEVGESCEGASECKSNVCLRHKPTPRGASICTVPCRSARECPAGGEWACANTARGGPTGYCIPAGSWTPRKATLPSATPTLAATLLFDAGAGGVE